MSNDSIQIKQVNGKTPVFSEFWLTIANKLGNSRLKINQSAESIRYFLAAESDHRDFLRQLIHQSYKRCHCYHLNAPFDVNVALDILGEISYCLQGNKEDDLLDIELLEEIGWLISQHYPSLIVMPESLISKSDKLSSKGLETGGACRTSGQMLSMSKRKIQRENRKL